MLAARVVPRPVAANSKRNVGSILLQRNINIAVQHKINLWGIPKALQ
jgi:hypothetical protein